MAELAGFCCFRRWLGCEELVPWLDGSFVVLTEMGQWFELVGQVVGTAAQDFEEVEVSYEVSE